MRIFLLLPFLLPLALFSQSAKPCKHSSFTQISMEPCNVDTCGTATYVLMSLTGIEEPATYRLISGNRADDQQGSIDSTAQRGGNRGDKVYEGKYFIGLQVNNNYSGEYFLEIKSAGREPLMLEGIRFKGPASYNFQVCMAKGKELQRYKYLGENKGGRGVLEYLN